MVYSLCVLGTRINNYELTRRIDEGSMGTVYEAVHALIDRRFAIKVLRREHMSDDAVIHRFVNEAKIISELRHPNIVEVFDAGTTEEGMPYLVMELLEGESLSARLARVKQLDLNSALEFALQAAQAIDAAHRYGVIHRDLKPDNFLIVPDPRVAEHELIKVLDFGIAKLRRDDVLDKVNTNLGLVLGTPAYMSPEQCRGVSSKIDHRTDIYALGVILYEMLAGAQPFDAEGVGELMMKHICEPPPRLRALRPQVPLAVDALVNKALAKMPADRFASMADFAATLAEAGATRIQPPRDSRLSSLTPYPPSFRPHVSASTPVPPTTGQAEQTNSASAAADTAVSVVSPANRLKHVVPTWLAGGSAIVALAATIALLTSPARHGQATASGPETTQTVLSKRTLDSPGGSSATVGAADRWGSQQTELAVRSQNSDDADTPAQSPSGEKSLVKEEASETATGERLPASGQRVVKPQRPTRASRPAVTPSTPQQAATISSQVPRASVQGATGGSNPSAAGPSGGAGALLANQAPTAGAEATPASVRSAASAELPAQAPATRQAQAAAPPAFGRLSFDSEPWANVYVNGRLLGSTPLIEIQLPAGKHTLVLKNPEIGRTSSYVIEVPANDAVSRFVGWDAE